MDEYFEEVCWMCRKVKMVHDDCRSSYDFICMDCEKVIEEWENIEIMMTKQ